MLNICLVASTFKDGTMYTEVQSQQKFPSVWRKGSTDTDGAYLQQLRPWTKHLIQTQGFILLSHNTHALLLKFGMF